MLVADDYYTLPSVSEDQLSTFENRYGIRFPASLRPFLLKVNGGRFVPGNFKINGTLLGEFILGGFMGVRLDDKLGAGLYCMQDLLDATNGIEEMPQVIGDPRKVFAFECKTGHDYFALNWNGHAVDAPSVWSINVDGGVSGHEIAPSWEAFLALQYEGDLESSVEFGAGWDQFSILVRHETRSLHGIVYRGFLGVKDHDLRLQTETADQACVCRSEGTWDLAEVRLHLGFTADGVPELSVQGPAKSRCSARSAGASRWMNEEGADVAGTIRGQSLDEMFRVFKELERLQQLARHRSTVP